MRPQIVLGSTHRKLRELGLSEAAVCSGTLRQLLATQLCDVEESHTMMADLKCGRFDDLASLYPEARFVFIGDSGEGDVMFAETFVAEDPESRVMALIHDVVEPDGVQPITDTGRRAALRKEGVVVFDTYVGAAVALHDQGLLGAGDLRAAAVACMNDFFLLHSRDWPRDYPAGWAERVAELERDWRDAQRIVREAGEPVRLSRRPPHARRFS